MSSHKNISRDKTEPIALVRRYVSSNLSGTIRLRDLAALCSMSRYHFIRHFHTATGMTPMRYVMACRIEAACDMIRDGVPLADVAGACGFANQAHFSTAFRKVLGNTPSRWRRLGVALPAWMSAWLADLYVLF